MNPDWVTDATETTTHFGGGNNQQKTGCKLVCAIDESEVCKGPAGRLPVPVGADALSGLLSRQSLMCHVQKCTVGHPKLGQKGVLGDSTLFSPPSMR